MTVISVPTQSYLQSIFTPDEYKDIQDCVLHCNEHFAYTQKSWQEIASDNKRTLIALITLIVSSVISYNTLRAPMLSIAMPSLYTIVKSDMLQEKVTKRLDKTTKTFLCVFQRYGSIQYSPPPYGHSFLKKTQDVASFIKREIVCVEGFSQPKGPPSISRFREIFLTYDPISDPQHADKGKKCLIDLVCLVFLQMYQDKAHTYTIDNFVDGCKGGVIGGCFTAMSVVAIRRLLQSPTSFSTTFKIVTIFFTCFFGLALIAAGKLLINAYKYHLHARNTGQEPVKELLPEVNTTLGINR